MKLLVPAVILFMLIPRPAAAQSADLLRLSDRFRAQSTAERSAALAEAALHGWPVRGVAADGTVFELQAISYGIPLYYVTFNTTSARSTRTDSVQVHIGGGDGMIIGLWDSGPVRATHRELAGRVTLAEGASSIPDDHATHVGGTLIAAGIRPETRGMAYGARLVSYNWSDVLAEGARAASDGLLAANHSWGEARGWSYRIVLMEGALYWYGDVTISEHEDYRFGFYDDGSRAWDELACAAPYFLIVASAGNDRDDSYPPGTEHRYYDRRVRRWVTGTDARDPDGGTSGYDCLPGEKQTAKNILVVGAAMDVHSYGGPADVEMTTYSCWGPTDDGRIKPDITGDGNTVYSCTAASDSSYGMKSGTSMASPNVCGSLALIADFYRDRRGGRPMRAATLRGLALHTAREAGDHPGPDYSFGWGLLDTYAAYELIVSDLDASRGLISELTLEEGRPVRLSYECDGNVAEMRFTICWHDPPGTPPAPALDPPDPMLVNDLDLRVSSRTVAYEPWVLDPAHPRKGAARGDNRVDNVEQVLITGPEAGLYTVTIDHKGRLEGGSQDVSLIVSGAVRVGAWHVRPDGSGDAPGIAAAVAAAGEGDYLLIHPGVYHEHDIVVDKALTILGAAGPDSTVIDALSRGRCIVIAKTDGAVRIEGLTLRRGLAPDRDADGFDGVGARVRPEGPAGCGGALFCENPAAVIRNCRITESSASRGGGIGLRLASPLVEDCAVFENDAAGDGGGIYLDRSDAFLRGCVVAGNAAGGCGGNICCRFSSPRIERCTISEGAAAGRGGGVYVGSGGVPEVASSIVSFSTAGRGIYCEMWRAGVTLRCCDVYGNAGGNYGGAVFDQTGRDGNFSADPLFCGGAARFGIGSTSPCRPGGNECGVLIGAASVRCLSARVCRVKPDGTGDMPTIQAALDAVSPGDTVLLAPGVFSGPGNRDLSFRGKGIVVRGDTLWLMTEIDCTGVGAEPHCGFDFSSGEDSTAVLEWVVIRRAAAGGVRCTNGSSPTIQDCSIEECVPGGVGRGGGMYLENSAARILETAFIENRTTGSGGGTVCMHSSPIFADCSFVYNSAEGNGGAIAVTAGSKVMIFNGKMYYNSAALGGGLSCDSSSVALRGGELLWNRARSGGGVSCGAGARLSTECTRFNWNSADEGGGGIACLSRAFVENCDIAYNTAHDHGAGIGCTEGDSVTIRTSIVAFNLVAEGIHTAQGDVDAACCDLFGNEGGDYGGATADLTGTSDNISADPDFCGSGGGIFDTSPCAPANSPCGLAIGARGVACSEAPDLVIADFIVSDTNPAVGDGINIYAKVKNTGRRRADGFWVDCYFNDVSGPFAGRHGDRRCLVDKGLAVGDSAMCAFMGVTSDAAERWETVAAVDVDGLVHEINEYNNNSWIEYILWSGADEIPQSTRLRSIRPNPANGETTIHLDLHRSAVVTVVIYDVAGRRVRTIAGGEPMPAGRREITWNGRDDGGHQAAAGIYFCRFTAGDVSETRKIALLR